MYFFFRLLTSVVSRSLGNAVPLAFTIAVEYVSPFLSLCFYVFLFGGFEVFVIVLRLLFEW